MSQASIMKAVEEYADKRPIYEALSNKVESIVKEILDRNLVEYYSIDSRTKTIERYKEKAFRGKYIDPSSEIMDMSGIRIITYTNKNAKLIFDKMNETFNIIPEHSIDKSVELGIDKVGYRSIHCVGTLGDERLSLPEYNIFKDMCFEIQIRTILQHAWAEFEHDRNYKFAGVLPDEIRRRLSILAGTLELIDKEFDDIATDIDRYTQDVENSWRLGDLNIPINTTSLRGYMNLRFKELIEHGVGGDIASNQIFEDLHENNIDTLKELDRIVPYDYIEKKLKYITEFDTLSGLLFDILIINYYKEYLLPDNKPQLIFTHKDIDLYKEYNIDLKKEIENLDLYIVDIS